MTAWLYVALGGAAGAMARHGVNQAMAWLGHPLPWATAAVNVAGSAAFGILAGCWAGRPAASPERLVLVVGFLGAFTTFSAYAGELATFWRQGRWDAFGLHLLLNNGLSLAAALLGLTLGASWGAIGNDAARAP